MHGIRGTHDPTLVLISIVLAILASYVALNLAGRVAVSSGRERWAWIAGGALAMGTGIWSMHFTAMLAYRLPVPIRYDISLWALSSLIPLVASAIALALIGRPSVSRPRWLVAGLTLGAAIAGMHYAGMAAARVPGALRYDPRWVVLSIVIAVVAAIAALWLLLHFRFREDRRALWERWAAPW